MCVDMHKNKKKSKNNVLFMIYDIVVITFSLYFALLLKFDFKPDARYLSLFRVTIIPLIIIMLLFNMLFNLYNNLWKYASIEELLSIIYSVTLSNIVFLVLIYVLSHLKYINNIYYRFPYTVHVMLWMLCVILCGGGRFIYRIVYENKEMNTIQDSEKSINLLIIGAGDAAALLIKEIKRNSKLNYKIVGLIDDNVNKIGKHINGIQIVGNRDQIIEICNERGVEEIIIAIPSASTNSKKQIINICKNTDCTLKILPGISEMIDDKVKLDRVRNVNIEDLLGREEVKLDDSNIKKYINNKVVMVTGGGGSIGSELCRQIAKFKPEKLLILDIYENSVYTLQRELDFSFPELDKEVIIASIRDFNRLHEVFDKYRPEVVFHAAAHKHVPLMEENPREAIKNNIFGTYKLLKCCDEFNVKKFVQISTDKAVNPTNIMGATKRFCEIMVQAFDKVSKTEFVAVRFGNVLGSNGSVIPLFKKQIEHGGPLTVTHPDITRYFMTIPEAAQLVIQAGAMAKGGEIFVLDMGQPVKIVDLAKDLITLSGLTPDVDIKIKYTGLRPGEKLYEELLMSEVALTSTEHDKIMIEKPKDIEMSFVENSISELKDAIGKGKDDDEIFNLVQKIIPTYKRKKNK